MGEESKTPDRGSRIEYLAAWASLIRATAWPIVAILILLIFAGPLKSLLVNVSNFTFKGPGVELMAKLERSKGATKFFLGEAIEKRAIEREQTGGSNIPSDSGALVTRTVDALVTEQTAERLAGALVLWVDDHPEYNILERRALGSLGVRFTTITNTDTAKSILAHSNYDAVISDLSREDDGCKTVQNEAACSKCKPYRLLEWIKTKKLQIPFIFYTSQDKAAICRNDAIAKGAFSITGEPSKLLELMVGIVSK